MFNSNIFLIHAGNSVLFYIVICLSVCLKKLKFWLVICGAPALNCTFSVNLVFQSLLIYFFKMSNGRIGEVMETTNWIHEIPSKEQQCSSLFAILVGSRAVRDLSYTRKRDVNFTIKCLKNAFSFVVHFFLSHPSVKKAKEQSKHKQL